MTEKQVLASNTTIDHAARLRGFAADLRSIGTGGGSTMDAAADEIERLRADLEALRDAADAYRELHRGYSMHDADRFRAHEILRAELEKRR